MKLDRDNWRLDPKSAPAGGMTALGIHLSDFCVFPGIGKDCLCKNWLNSLGASKKDTLSVNIRFKNNVTASLAVMISTPFYGRFTVFGEKGWVEIREVSNVDFDDPAEFIYCDKHGKRVVEEHPVVNTVKLNFEEWADAVAGRSTYRINIDEVVSNVQILESIINSAEKNRVLK